MIKYKVEKVSVRQAEKITCDVCKKEYNVGNGGITEDEIETQEFHHINFTGGFGSVFGDGAVVKVDICQHCLKKLVGEYVQIDEDVEA